MRLAGIRLIRKFSRMPHISLQQDLQYATDLARGAGRVVLDHYGKVERLTKTHVATWDSWVYRLPILIGAIFLMPLTARVLGAAPLYHVGDFGTYLLALVTVGGISFTWWARIHLGRFWSNAITHKEDHKIIDTGYRPELEGYSAFEATDLANMQGWTGVGAVDLELDRSDELVLVSAGAIRFAGLPGDQEVLLDPDAAWQLVTLLP